MKIELQSDGEPAIKLLLKRVAESRPDGMTLLRHSIPGNPQSNGGAERWVQTVKGATRTVQFAFGKMLGKRILSRSKWGSLCLRHAVWLRNRTHKRPDGKTPWEVIHESPYTGKIFRFGELVLAKPNRPRAGMENPWEEGVWVGRRVGDDGHIH